MNPINRLSAWIAGAARADLRARGAAHSAPDLRAAAAEIRAGSDVVSLTGYTGAALSVCVLAAGAAGSAGAASVALTGGICAITFAATVGAARAARAAAADLDSAADLADSAALIRRWRAGGAQ